MLINDTETYRRASFVNEAEIENVVQKYADRLFGSSILYLSQTRIATMGGKGSIPDAIVIDLEGEQWYLVEAERAIHGTWEHIAPQVSKQLAALTFPDTRQAILQSALTQIAQDQNQLQIFTDLEISQIEIHGYIHAILQKPVIIAIPIDGIPKDLTDWMQTLRNQTRVWFIEKYVATTDSTRVLYSLPDENLPTIETSIGGSSTTTAVTTRSSQPFQELLEAGILKTGEELFMEYGPRGQPRQKYTAIVHPDGLSIDGQVYSASYAAVYFINKAGSPRKTANGWILWRNSEGKYLDDLYTEFKAAKSSSAGEPATGHFSEST
jgi:Restriction Enzyme Adenine Methylase Associated